MVKLIYDKSMGWLIQPNIGRLDVNPVRSANGRTAPLASSAIVMQPLTRIMVIREAGARKYKFAEF